MPGIINAVRFRRDEKRFIDEVLLRMERSERRTVARFEATMEEIQQHRLEFAEYRREHREEYLAHRESLMAILDQLKRLEPPPAGT